MDRNKRIALGIILISISLIVLKRIFILLTWRRMKSNIVGIKKVEDGRSQILYSYEVNKKRYTGVIMENEINENDKEIMIFVHKLNPHLSIREIPLYMEDYVFIILGLLGGIYLYLYDCECLSVEMNNLLGIPN